MTLYSGLKAMLERLYEHAGVGIASSCSRGRVDAESIAFEAGQKLRVAAPARMRSCIALAPTIVTPSMKSSWV